MIGSIGVDNRYSTSYNNLKPNRGSDKWANTFGSDDRYGY